MLGFNSWRRFKFLATFLCVVGIVSFAVAYFIPAPPTTVTIATAFKGSTFVYYGEKYREIFARSHVKLELRETNGAVDNLRLLQDPKSGVDIGFVNGGVSKGSSARTAVGWPHVQQCFLDILSIDRNVRPFVATKRQTYRGR